MNLDTVITFLGWNTVIHFATLWLSTGFLRWGLPLIGSWYAAWTWVPLARLRELVLLVLVAYKTLIWVLFAVPYVVLKWVMV